MPAIKPMTAKEKGKMKMSLKERIIFTEQLAVMLNAGIPLPQSLRSLEEETMNKQAKRMFGDMATSLEGGIPFSQVLREYQKSFAQVFISMIKSAEQTGNLAGILSTLTEQQRKDFELKGKVKGALMYPMVITVLMVGVIILIVTFVIPKLATLFASSGAPLPLSTRFLLASSDFMVHKWYLLLIIIGGGILVLKKINNTEKGRYFFDNLKLKFPIIGSFMKKAAVARFAQTFSFLSHAGVPVLEIFGTLKGVVGNAVLAKDIEQMEKDVSNGIPLSNSIRKSKNFPRMVGQLTRVGEQSGDLGKMFEVIGNFFEKEVDQMAKNLSTLLEPIIMVVMGGVIGFILISVLQPMYGLLNTVN